MYCKKCGQNLADGTPRCPICGQILSEPTSNPTQFAPPVAIKTYLTEAILVTLFCCMPFGVVAIVNAANASGFVGAGRYAEAQQAADNAWKWVKISFIIGLFGTILGIAFQVILFAAGAATAK